jgi:hypothetical protein
MTKKVKLPEQVAVIYRAVQELEERYPGRKFTPDGHLVGSIGEVVAAEALKLTLHPASRAGYDAYDENGEVQIKNDWRQQKYCDVRRLLSTRCASDRFSRRS